MCARSLNHNARDDRTHVRHSLGCSADRCEQCADNEHSLRFLWYGEQRRCERGDRVGPFVERVDHGGTMRLAEVAERLLELGLDLVCVPVSGSLSGRAAMATNNSRSLEGRHFEGVKKNPHRLY